MPSTVDIVPARVYEPSKSGASWLLTIVDSIGQKHVTKYARKQDAKKEATRIKGLIARAEEARKAAADSDILEFDGTLQWFFVVLGKVCRKVAVGAGPEARNDLKAIASAGVAAKQLYDTSDLERRLAEAEKALIAIQGGEHYGTRTQRATESPGKSTSSGQSLH